MYALPYFALQWLRQRMLDARRRGRPVRYVTWTVLAGALNGVMISIALAFIALLWTVGLWYLALVIVGVLLVPALATTLIRYLIVPTGWHRVAYYAGQYSRPGPDAPAYALCAAAWACRAGDGDAIAWVEAMRARRTPLGDGEVAATGLVAASRGDLDTARALLRSLAMLVENHAAVRELAGEWLACDAAERGAWRELADDALAARAPATPLGYLLEGIALRKVDDDHAPAIVALWARWLVAPRRLATLPLVRAATAARPAAATASASTVSSTTTAPPAAPALPDAVAAHLAFQAQPVTAAGLAATVHAWDTALADDATRTWLARRALELDAPAGAAERAIADVAGAVTDDLARRAEAAQLAAPAAAAGPVGLGLTRRLRHGRLDALETAFTRWAEHRGDDARPAIDEWRELLALLAAYRAAVTAGGLELRRLAFPHAFTKGSKMAVWLWNTRKEYAMSHAISRWLLDEALAVGDTEAIELGHRNCTLTVPTRLGPVSEQTSSRTG
jgi:hypothetical protein